MNIDLINRIVYYIPIRKLRDAVREYLLNTANINIKAFDHKQIILFRENINSDKEFLSKYKKLINGLDDDSISKIFNILLKIMKYNNINDDVYFDNDESKIIGDIQNKFYNCIIEDKVNNIFIYNKYILSYNHFEINIFYEKHGLSNIKNIDFIRDKNIIDAGGYIGDSAIIFSDYTNKNIYSFEPFKNNYNSMLKTIELNNVENIVPINMALGNENKEIFIYYDGDNSSGLSIENKESEVNSKKETINMITLDKFVEEKNIKVGLIKTDLEGFEQKFLEGAVNTIKKQKPILMISIYHNYDDFFNIKPLIESWNLGYKFKIIKPKIDCLILETVLLAEVY
ncbi:FkbM family methyltransferase [Brachyspira alvinipulli]|uniref:FkbM family methyltransferase n=1 Tax=Brachyspira alvinipulli TaxID=84379 RepID=UPI003006BD16